MSIGIRIALVLAAVALFAYVLYSIRKSKMRIEDSLFWVFLSALTLLMSVFPQIASYPSRLLGFQAPVNFVFLFFIAVLMLKGFLTSRQVSRLETKVNELTQQVAVSERVRHEADAADEVRAGEHPRQP